METETQAMWSRLIAETYGVEVTHLSLDGLNNLHKQILRDWDDGARDKPAGEIYRMMAARVYLEKHSRPQAQWASTIN